MSGTKTTFEMVLEPMNQRENGVTINRALPVIHTLLAQSDEIKRLLARELLAGTRYEDALV